MALPVYINLLWYTGLMKNPNHARHLNLLGRRFGRLKVIKQAESHPKKGRMWSCLCECGEQTEKETSSLLRGNSRSCGCLFKEQLVTKHFKKTGLSCSVTKLPEYRIWMHAKQRCENPNDNHYYLYGARGIEMKLTFKQFIEEVGSRPDKKLSIDRIDPDGHYEKGNLRWADAHMQAQNTRKVRAGGVYKRDNGRWIAIARDMGKQIYLGTFDTEPEARAVRLQAINKLYYGI